MNEATNKFDLIDVEPKFIEFFYDNVEDVDSFIQSKNNVIEKKILKIKNACTKTQNVNIFESESRYLKIKGVKKKKLAPGTSEKILVEFSFSNLDVKKYRFGKKKDILNILNNVECKVSLKIQSEYTTVHIPIYIKKKVPIFIFDNIINLGICKSNRTYHYSLKVKNGGSKRGKFTISMDNIVEEEKTEQTHDYKRDDKPTKVHFNGDINKRKKEETERKDVHTSKNDLFVQFDKTTVDLNINETATINITIKNKREEKIYREYKVYTKEHSYFSEKIKNVIIIAIFTNSQTSFIFENEKRNQINLNYMYLGHKKKFQGQIKNENNYPVFCTHKVGKVNAFFSMKEFEAYSEENGLDIDQLSRGEDENGEGKFVGTFIAESPYISSVTQNEMSEEERKEKEKLFAIAKKRLKQEENITVRLSKEDGYTVEKLSYHDVSVEVQSKCDVHFLEKVNRNMSYLLNFPVVVELMLYVCSGESGVSCSGGIRCCHENCDNRNLLDEEIKLFLVFCLTFPCVVSNTYFLNYETVSLNEGKTLIIEVTNRNKFLQVSYCFSKIPYLTLNRKEGCIDPMCKEIITLKLKCDTIKKIDEYIYVFFCNNLYFFAMLMTAEVKSAYALRQASSLHLEQGKGEKSLTNKGSGDRDLGNCQNDEIFEKIIKKLDLEKVDKNLYLVDGKLDRYKYNENFIAFLKNNKKKYNDILKHMYEKRRGRRKDKTNMDMKEKEEECMEKKKLKKKISKVINDMWIYINDTGLTKISNTCIQHAVYEERRKKYMHIKREHLEITDTNSASNDRMNVPCDEILEEHQLDKIIFSKNIHFNNVLLNISYKKEFTVHNSNTDCNIRLDFTQSDNVKIDNDMLIVGTNSNKNINLELKISPFFKKVENMTNEEGTTMCLSSTPSLQIERKNSMLSNYSEIVMIPSVNDFLLQQIYTERIPLKLNNTYEQQVTVKANLILLNVLIKEQTLHFYFENSDVQMYCERQIILYNPFDFPVAVSMGCNGSLFQIDTHISVSIKWKRLKRDYPICGIEFSNDPVITYVNLSTDTYLRVLTHDMGFPLQICPNSCRMVPIKFLAPSRAGVLEDFIYIYLDGERLYKRVQCICFVNKCSYKTDIAEMNFENIILNKHYTKDFYLINTADYPLIFECSHKPECVYVQYKYSYVQKNERLKVTVSVNLKDGKKVKDKIVFSVRGAENLVIPISAKVRCGIYTSYVEIPTFYDEIPTAYVVIEPSYMQAAPSNVLFMRGLHIKQESCEMMDYEMDILNKGICEEKVVLDLTELNFLSINIREKKEKKTLTYNSKEYKHAEEKRDDFPILREIFQIEYEDIITEENTKWYYNKFIGLYNFLCSYCRSRGNIQFTERREKSSQCLYMVNIPPKSFVSMYINCYYDKTIKKKMKFNSLLLQNKIIYEKKEEEIKVEIDSTCLDISPACIHFTNVLPANSHKSLISYFTKEKKKTLKIKNVSDYPIEWKVFVYTNEQKKVHLMRRTGGKASETATHEGKQTVRGVFTGERAAREIAANQIAENQIGANKIGVNKIAAKQIATKQIATKQIATKQIATKQIATKQIATKQIAAKQIATKQSVAVGVSNRDIETKGDSVMGGDEVEEVAKAYELDVSKQSGLLKPEEGTEIEVKIKNVLHRGRYVEILGISATFVDNEMGKKTDSNVGNTEMEVLKSTVRREEKTYCVYMLLTCETPKLFFDVTYINIIHNKLNEWFTFPFHIYNSGYDYVRVKYHFNNLHEDYFSLSLDFEKGGEINENVKKINVSLKCKAYKNVKFKSNLSVTVLEHDQYNIPFFVNIDENIDYLLDNAGGVETVSFQRGNDNGEKTQKGDIHVGNKMQDNIDKREDYHYDNPWKEHPEGTTPFEGCNTERNISIQTKDTLLPFFYSNTVEKDEEETVNIYKGLQIRNITNVYYNDENLTHNLTAILNDYIFMFIGRIMLNKSYLPYAIENTNDLFLFFLNLLHDLFLLYPNRNVQKLINGIKFYENIAMTNFEKNTLLHENILQNVKGILKHLKEEKLLVDHILYENLLPVDVYMYYIFNKIPEHFYVKGKKEEMGKNDKGDSDEYICNVDVNQFLLNGGEGVFFFDRVFKTHLKLFSYSWITIFLEFLNKNMCSCVNVNSLSKLRGIKLCSIENEINENIKMIKINYLIVLNKQDRELNKHTAFLDERKRRSRRSEGTSSAAICSAICSGNGSGRGKGMQRMPAGVVGVVGVERGKKTTPIKEAKGGPRNGKNAHHGKRMKVGVIKNSSAINYFNFYENNFIDLKKVVQKINSLNCEGGGEEGEKRDDQLTLEGSRKEIDTNSPKDSSPMGELREGGKNGILKREAEKEQKRTSHKFKGVECILFEWLYFHYNNVHYTDVQNERYVFKEGWNENEKVVTDLGKLPSSRKVINVGEVRREEVGEEVTPHHEVNEVVNQRENSEGKPVKLNKSDFYMERRKKKTRKHFSKKKDKVTSVHELKDLVMIIYTLISHIPYYLFFKNKIKVHCKTERDYINNVDILLVILNELKLNNLISRKVLIEFNYIHMFIFLTSLYFILPNYLPSYYLLVDDSSSYKNDIYAINEELTREKKMKNVRVQGENKKIGIPKNVSKVEERVITIYNLNSYKCKYNVFLIGCNKYHVDKNFIHIDPLKSEEIKIKIDKNYEEAMFKYDYSTSIKFSPFKNGFPSDAPRFDDSDGTDASTASSHMGRSSSTSCLSDDSHEEDARMGKKTNHRSFRKNENYAVIVLRSECYLPEERDSEGYICIRLVEGSGEKETVILENKGNLKDKKNEGSNLNVDMRVSGERNDASRVRPTHSSQINIMLSSSEVKCFNLRGKAYERKSLEINLINNTEKRVEVNSNVYHLYIRDLKKEEKEKDNFEMDMLTVDKGTHEMYNQCVVCSMINANLRNYLNEHEHFFSCFYVENGKDLTIGKNERRKIQLHFCPFVEGNYFGFLLFCVKDRRTKYLFSTCKVNCFFYINNVKEDEVIKMNTLSYNFTYDMKLNPINKEFLKCVKFVLCTLNKMDKKYFMAYLKSYLKSVNQSRHNFYITCDKYDKVAIKKSFFSFQNLDYARYVSGADAGSAVDVNVDELCDAVKRDTNCFCNLNMREESGGVYEYNCILLVKKNHEEKKKDISNLVSYEDVRNMRVKDKNCIHEMCYRLYKIIANVDSEKTNKVFTIVFNTSAYILSKKSIPIYNYTNEKLTYKCIHSEIIDQHNNKIDYNIFKNDEYVEIPKDIETFNFEVICYSIVEVVCSCIILMTNVENEEDQIKVNVSANIKKPYPKETIHIKVLNRMKKTVQMELFNELDFHCEFKVYSDLPILFGDKKIEMLPKQRKIYTFFVRSAHIGEFVGCLIFKFFNLVNMKGTHGSTRYNSSHHDSDRSNSCVDNFPFSDYFFWYKLNITVELNQPLKILLLETTVGDEISKEIVLKNNGREKEKYFLLTYMHEFTERTQIEIPKNDIHVYNIKYAPKIPNYFDNLRDTTECYKLNSEQEQIDPFRGTTISSSLGHEKERASSTEGNDPSFTGGGFDIAQELSKFYFPPNEESEEEMLVESAVTREWSSGRAVIGNAANGEETNGEETNGEEAIGEKDEYAASRVKNLYLKSETIKKGGEQPPKAASMGVKGNSMAKKEHPSLRKTVKQKGKKNFPHNEKRLFEELIKYCKRYINVSINYTSQNIGFLFIYNKKEGVNYYILILLAKLRDELRISNFSACLSKSCFIHLHFDFNSEEKRYVNMLSSKENAHSNEYFYQVGEYVRQRSSSDAGKDKHKVKCIYLSNRTNYTIGGIADGGVDVDVDVNVDIDVDVDVDGLVCEREDKHTDEPSNHVVIRYKPTTNSSKGCYALVRSDIYGDFLYFVKGVYTVKRKIKEKMIMYNSGCLYHFNVNLFNPFNCKVCINCRFKRRRDEMGGGSHIISDSSEHEAEKRMKERSVHSVSVKKEKVLINNEKKYFKILSRENFTVNKRRHFSLLMTYFCKKVTSVQTLEIVLKPLHDDTNRGSLQSIAYQYKFVFKNTQKGSLIGEKHLVCDVPNDEVTYHNRFDENSLTDSSTGGEEPYPCNVVKKVDYNHVVYTKLNEVFTTEEGEADREEEKHSWRMISTGNGEENMEMHTNEGIGSPGCGSTTTDSECTQDGDLVSTQMKRTPFGVCEAREDIMEEQVEQENCRLSSKDVVYYDGKLFIESICKTKTQMLIYIDKKKMMEREDYDKFIDELENRKREKNMLHRNVKKGKYNYKIFLINLKNLNSNWGGLNGKTCIKMNNILFDMNEELLNNYLYMHIVKDTPTDLVLSLELLAYLPFHCSFCVVVKRVAGMEEADGIDWEDEIYADGGERCVQVECLKREETRKFTTVEKNYISVEIFNYINVSEKYINVFVDRNLCSETKLNIFYRHTNDSYFEAYMVSYNQMSNYILTEEIKNFEIKPQSGILKHGSHNMFLITRINKNNLVSFSNSFLLLIKTERNIFSYIIFSRYSPPRGLRTTREQNMLKEILNENKKKFSVVFNTFRQEKKESAIFNKKDQIIIEDISKSTSEIRNY
ncbi:conserved Plasmodium protein, unknown function [Plasmodium ovale wallikeri]|uniref:Uncharacterized protein n=1 Tax=Plasmodium ovale wallikeri TaxID=864142 RepID=A0A1A8YN49_PLAOA|nr:conserved Plasmodium protein, unknown function [Plasmodium ovale wallikeri]SBT33011.1 conserved Plasmodium protein, unknown function [Plasmodium ovale wallikeri]